MSRWYDRYLQGFYQEVYDELLTMQEQVFEVPIYTDALSVAKEMMRRVRHNIELLIPRLEAIGYDFGAGFFDQFEDTPELLEQVKQACPIFKPPTVETPEQVARLEQLVGPLPLSLKCWYEEVGSVNLVGLFPYVGGQAVRPNDESHWDPLFIYSIDVAIQMVMDHIKYGTWSLDPTLSLSPDRWFKYGFGGAGAYSIRLPWKGFDASLLGEEHHTTFVNYLRLCFQWGGFPGLETDQRFPHGQIEFLNKDMLPF